jgi:hypothetical protein
MPLAQSTLNTPHWFMVDIHLERVFQGPPGLPELSDVAAPKRDGIAAEGLAAIRSIGATEGVCAVTRMADVVGRPAVTSIDELSAS